MGTALATPALIGRAAAQSGTAAAPRMQTPGFFRFRVGSFTVTTLLDGFSPWVDPATSLVVNADRAAVEGALRDAMLPPAQINDLFALTLLETPAGLTLFDSGTGGQLVPTAGMLPASLAAAGVDPARVERVVLSHCHLDHITGLTTPDNVAVFPNARILLPEAEWNFWTDASNEARVPDYQRNNFANIPRRLAPYRGRVERFAPGAEILPGVRAVAAPGHTPGHTVFHVAEGADQLFIMGDTASRPELFLRHPEWHHSYDIDPVTASATRFRLFDRIAAERARMTAYHFPFPANGHVRRVGEGFIFVPADWSTAL
ncbi:MBL fold metallo-hydrolase [Roseococcus microcysteis]|uniref:MBL fold metallo-hydrolase n=1 Tax=Roseococcus microcysteis TaxID=2771361 RepID=UPI001CC55891|nr:MBL fold metallo-hydrolase [Roseococcus microcysteis]